MKRHMVDELAMVRGVGATKATEIIRVLTTAGWPIEIDGCACYYPMSPTPEVITRVDPSCPIHASK